MPLVYGLSYSTANALRDDAFPAHNRAIQVQRNQGDSCSLFVHEFSRLINKITVIFIMSTFGRLIEHTLHELKRLSTGQNDLSMVFFVFATAVILRLRRLLTWQQAMI